MLINEQISRSQVANPISTLPSIATDDVVSLMRIDKSFGTARISNAIMDAYDIINRQISPWRTVQDERFVRAYKRAVLHEAAALLSDLYVDFDTIGQGQIRGENMSLKSDSLRRIVSHAVADMNGTSRNRIRLL